MTESPSARILKAAQQTEVLTDGLGRKLTVRNLNALDQYRLLLAMGPEHASNQSAVWLAESAAMVADIDGVPRPMPTNQKQIQVAIEKLGDEGMAAAMIWRTEKVRQSMEAAERAIAGEEGAQPQPGPLEQSAQ